MNDWKQMQTTFPDMWKEYQKNQTKHQLRFSSPSQNVCPICGGSGILLNEQNQAVPCQCWQQKRIAQKKKEAHLLPALTQMHFDNFSFVYYPRNAGPEQRQKKQKSYYDFAQIAKAKAEKFTKAIIGGQPTKGLLLEGQIGSGKTHLAAAIANELLAAGQHILFLVVPDFLDELRNSYHSSGEFNEIEIMEQAKNIPVLILDDLGNHNFTEWTQNKLFSLINYRLNQQLPSIITTNLDIPSLAEVLGQRVVSRIIASCEVCLLPVPKDIRLLKNLKHEDKNV